MLNALIRFALLQRTLVLAGSAILLGYGAYLSMSLPIDIFPDLDRPRVILLTECPGLAPEEIEQRVTQPLEVALLGASGVEAVRSQSGHGMVVVYVDFGWKTTVYQARQIVTERLAGVVLPPRIRPIMTPPASVMGQILHVGVSRRDGPRGGTLTPLASSGLLAERNAGGVAVWKPVVRDDPAAWELVAELPADAADFTHAGRRYPIRFPTALEEAMSLRTLAEWTIRPRLLKEAGIAEVIVIGGERKQYQVLIDPAKLEEYRVSLAEVEAAIQANNLNASGGYVDQGPSERAVRVIALLGPDAEAVKRDLERVVVEARGDRSLLLGQVAQIVEGPAPKRGDASVNGSPGVVVTIVKQPHADTRALTDHVETTLRDFAANLPADIVINTELFQLKSFIDRGVYYVGEALVIGAALVVVVVFMFLVNFRTTCITLAAIPLSLMVTVCIFRLIGLLTGQELSINVMTLGGIAVAMGELVDDAIVDVENIYRRLQQNARLPEPRPGIVVVYAASREIRSAVVFGTAVVILSFLPLFAFSGVEGRLFIPLGLAYITSILASLFVSLTVTPVLSYYLLAGRTQTSGHHDGRLLRVLKWFGGQLIWFSMKRIGVLLVLTWIGFGLAVWQITRVGGDFLPKFDEGNVQLDVILPGNASLAATNEMSHLVDARLRRMQRSPANPDGAIVNFFRRSGRAELDEHAEPVSRSEYLLSIAPDAVADRDNLLAELRDDLAKHVPGVEIEAEQPLGHLISHMLSGVRSQIAVKVFGDDLDRLREIATRIREVMADVPGTTQPIIDLQERVDEVHVVLRPDDLAYFGLSREFVAHFVEIALKGDAVSVVLDGTKRFDLVVKLQEPYRSNVEQLGELRLDLPEHRGFIRLKEVADFPPTASGPNLVNHENGRRRQVIQCNVAGRDLDSTVAEMQDRIAKQIELPPGYYIEFGGVFEAQREATRLIAVLAVVSFLGVGIVLHMLVGSVRMTLQILHAIPTAFVGGVAALTLSGQSLSVASLVGFISLGGIAVRNGILLMTHYFHLMREEGKPFSRETILQGSLERLSPVLMTALTAGIALLPLIVGGQKPGLEILYPVATVIVGGLVTSTFCEFLLHPGLFWRFSGRDAASRDAAGKSDRELLAGSETV